MSSRRRGRRHGAGTLSVAVIVLGFLIVMGIQIYNLKLKDGNYAKREQELQEQYEEETQRSAELDELEEYMKSSEYIEDTAKSKLGLTYKDEIIFKEEESGK